eukprot:TRINITY_DN17860_c0_g1_i3.p1 TRINITY_DN17860_c0_g1~~TRINITY_DN17860_c0_g1_i3.p1  ORF type:complete len:235 (+),score=34.26 TRINITY_DN17860_c0_g1_i3:104-808(+)
MRHALPFSTLEAALHSSTQHDDFPWSIESYVGGLRTYLAVALLCVVLLCLARQWAKRASEAGFDKGDLSVVFQDDARTSRWHEAGSFMAAVLLFLHGCYHACSFATPPHAAYINLYSTLRLIYAYAGLLHAVTFVAIWSFERIPATTRRSSSWRFLALVLWITWCLVFTTLQLRLADRPYGGFWVTTRSMFLGRRCASHLQRCRSAGCKVARQRFREWWMEGCGTASGCVSSST